MFVYKSCIVQPCRTHLFLALIDFCGCLTIFIFKRLSSTHRGSVTFPFQPGCLFISFSHQLSPARSSSTVLNRSSPRGPPCLVLDLKRKSFRLATLFIMWAVAFFVDVFSQGEYNLFLVFWVFFSWIFWILWSNLSAWFLFFINIVYFIDWLLHVEPTLYSWVKSHLSWCIILFMSLDLAC